MTGCKFDYDHKVRYTVSVGDGGHQDEIRLTTFAAGRRPIAGAVRGLSGRVLRGEVVSIEGSDGSEYVISGRWCSLPPLTLPHDVISFFEVELQNDEPEGRISTLGSALDTLVQAPDYVLDEWFGARVDAAACTIKSLAERFGYDTQLRVILEAASRTADEVSQGTTEE